MKRARVDDAPRSSIVRLNVGGQMFQTTRETLCGSAFFRSLLEHGLDGDKDPEGNIFVDRSGKLFEEILDSLRTRRRPHQRIIALWKHQLLEECKFFGADEVAARIMGHTVEADLCPLCRIIAVEERERRGCLIDVFETPLKRKDVEELQLDAPLLLPATRARERQDRVLAGNKSHCHDALNVNMGGILRSLEADPLISSCCVVAGGSIVSALTGCSAGPNNVFLSVSAVVNAAALAGMPNAIPLSSIPPPTFFHLYLPSLMPLRLLDCPMLCHLPSSPAHVVICVSRPGDVDIFVVAPTPGDEIAVLSKIYDITMASCKDSLGEKTRILVTRSKAAVTLFRQQGPPIQIILSTYSSLEELLAGFDIDCACCAFVLGTGQFVCTARGRRALEHRVNVMMSNHHSCAYASRLEKYAHRGPCPFATGRV